MINNENGVMDVKSEKCLIIVCSYHHNNTAKIAKLFAEDIAQQFE